MGKNIALIAHDNCKHKLISWAQEHLEILNNHKLFATGTTGKMLQDKLQVPIELYKSGPMGGDLQIGAAIVDGNIDCMVFLWDPSEPHPHDVDVKALLRIAVVYDIPVACNVSSASFMIHSPLMDADREVAESETIVEYGQAAIDSGFAEIAEEFAEENAALVERFKGGFESLLDVLANKAVKKIGGDPDIHLVRQALQESFSQDDGTKLDDAQKQVVLRMMRQIHNSDEINTICEDFLEGNGTDAIEELAKSISQIEWRCKEKPTFEFLQAYFEMFRERYDQIKEAKEQEETSEEES